MSSRRPSGRAARAAVVQRRRQVLALAVVVAAIVIVVVVAGGGGGKSAPPLPAPRPAAPAAPGDPFAWTPARSDEFAQRASLGEAHVLYDKSPGGIAATAARVNALRPLIVAATNGSGVSADDLEGIVLLESAGRPDALASNDLTGAAGLTQILASTATSLLGLHVNVARSTQLTRAIVSASDRGDTKAVARYTAERMRVDERFDPRKALAATVRYLQISNQHFGRADLDVESYHMGIGNLTNVIAAYGGPAHPSYAQLYFDSSPVSHAAAWRLLSGFGDESSLYYWKVLAAEHVMATYRSAAKAFDERAKLQDEKASNENVLHPPGVDAFARPDALRRAYASGAIVPLPSNAAALGIAVSPDMGSLASRLGEPIALYRGLRPGALALLIAFVARVRALDGSDAPLTLTSTVRDQKYQDALADSNPEATQGFSVHTTGWSFDFARRYASNKQADAVQFVLDRLQALNLIAWVREPTAIHVTVASDVGKFVHVGS